ncbi:ATP-binding protein [Fulvimarina sp. 2208YS6-2-32]|uniref:histidine kinase n=1 Tax=Fulvimarina uroteuthidis TaxID=3098149 RepID=A0ABU5I427_9HYPH|nr:ATP-binding protein [Fulvimarina sp. 2208YS6-2-32]MDY8109961.1 ATP-binding protein [Fulvimarina sp. 2208YS6-2-32]
MARQIAIKATGRAGRKGRHAIERQFWLVRGLVALAIAVLALLAILGAGRFAGQAARSTVVQNAVETLNVQAAVLDGILDKHRLLPPLLAGTDQIRSILSPPGAPLIDISRRDALLAVGRIAAMSGALDVALFSPGGEIIASARDLFPSVSRPLQSALETARQSRLGRQSLFLGNGQHAYAFVSIVRRERAILGYIAVLVGFESVEATWTLSTDPIFVTDSQERVLLTNRPEWGLETLLDVERTSAGHLKRVDRPETTYLDLARDMPLLDWRIHVLVDRSPIAAARTFAEITAAFVVLLLGAIAALALRRHEQVILKERRDRAIALGLERVVRERTRALSLANAQLTGEIEERRQAERKLRTTQNELVQTAKLAGLGQMAAALGHEFNQPIASIRTYADNAARLIATERVDRVPHNLTRIAAMTDRMAEISKTLLAFSRKPGTTASPTCLGPVLDEAMILVRPRLRKAGVTLTIDPALRDLAVLGGKIRLSQVFVNLFNNAADAMAHRTFGTIEAVLAKAPATGGVEIEIRDDGPGIPKDLKDSVFDPFVTTKPSGEGIGIGLSIVSNILADFGGSIRLVESGSSGTVFAIRLQNIDTRTIAAA